MKLPMPSKFYCNISGVIKPISIIMRYDVYRSSIFRNAFEWSGVFEGQFLREVE